MTKPLILIIDDDPQIRSLLTITLSTDYAIVTALTGEMAGRLTELVVKPDLIILDWNLGPLSRMTGPEACQFLHARFPLTPILLMSGDWHLQDRELVSLLQQCAVDFMRKPYTPSTLLVRVAKLLGEEVG